MQLNWRQLAAVILVTLSALCTPALAMTQAQALAVVSGSNNDRIAAINDTLTSGSPTIEPFFTALMEQRVQYTKEQVLIVNDTLTIDAVTGKPVNLVADATPAKLNNRLRRALRDALSGLRLFSSDRQTRLTAATAMTSRPNKTALALFKVAAAKEKDQEILQVLALGQARAEVTDDDPGVRLAAAQTLANSDSLTVRQLLRDRLAKDGDGFVEPDPQVRKALHSAYANVEHKVFMAQIAGTLFTGISLGSVLLLAALGLAITYGLMGVINLAHGELMMIGAYATYLGQEAFRRYLPPQLFDRYLFLAVPLSFLLAAMIGALMERFVIRHLYGRPLETLLATWGISLILMQAVRNLFGAQNVAVENPGWMSGGLKLAQNLVLPYNRIAIILFALMVMAAVGLVIARTRLGLFVRAATQNRTMARCVGVPTQRTDLMAFALGSGVAGLAGCALSQIGNVGPDLGQSYIVDSFLVVVVGGVGQLAGAVTAALGLGIFNKILEEMTGAVIAKIILLAVVIVFIQRRPQGIFALQGRSAQG